MINDRLFYLYQRLQTCVIVATWFIIAAIVVGVSLFSYHATDTTFFFHATVSKTDNVLGPIGANVAAMCAYLFGIASWLLVPLLLFYAYLIMYRTFADEWERVVASFVGLLISSALVNWHCLADYYSVVPGGYVGLGVIHNAKMMCEPIVVGIFLYTLFIALVVLLTRFFYMPMLSTIFMHGSTWVLYVYENQLIQKAALHCWHIGKQVVATCAWSYKQLVNVFSGKYFAQTSFVLPEDKDDQEQELQKLYQSFFVKDKKKQKRAIVLATKDNDSDKKITEKLSEDDLVVAYDNEIDEQEALEKDVAFDTVQKTKKKRVSKAQYKLPNLSIFIGVDHEKEDAALEAELKERALLLMQKLQHFGIQGEVTAINRGPVVTVYEYKPSISTKLSKILALEDDLSMALKAKSIRILAPIPGKSVVGFEVANDNRKGVVLATGMNSDLYRDFQGALPLILGEDTSGNTVLVDLVKMPHLLVAGSTGSGKSVGLNAMLMSLLCKSTPDELKLILVDPKRLEFSSYADMAHLLFPIVVDPKKAIGILRWVVREMEARYEKLANVGVRNIVDYNVRAKEVGFDHLPYIVVVIDELSDLMMTAGKDIEDVIARIAQMARASGIHLILATQRPSVDVITGLIKVNFPSRISFRVTSRVDSRTILDVSGAEKLLGRGDMLFLDSTQANLRRIHGAYVSDKEIRDVVDHIKSLRDPEYLELETSFEKDYYSLEKPDELLDEIVTFLENVEGVSISLLQRKFRIGYNRSARIIDELERQGLIMPPDGSKLRKVIR